MKTLQIVGFKNSGKTTLIENWLEVLQQEDLDVSVIKHHGHEGALELPSAETDSMKYFHKGATSSVVVGDGMVQFHNRRELDLNQLIELSMVANPDVILVEGFKREPLPKVVLVRSEEDWEILCSLQNIVLVVCLYEMVLHTNNKVINRHNQQQLNDWIRSYANGTKMK